MAKKTGIGSYPADDSESGRSVEVDTGNAVGSKKGRKKRNLAADPKCIQEKLDRYRDQMAEDAPASNSPEDNV